jgi:putative phage-type endonuclease
MLKFTYNKDLEEHSELKQKFLRDQVLYLQSLDQPTQKSHEWYKSRNNMLTASDLGAILEENSYNSPNSVLIKKCGYDNSHITNPDMIWGNKYEPVAQKIYEIRNNTTVLKFGLLQHNSVHYLGASPDGITPDGVMLEIKCPSKRQITGNPKEYYLTQVYAQLEVCDLERCDFLECNFKEYESEQKYFSDKKLRSEKGVIAKFLNRESGLVEYDYSPINMSYFDLQKWKIEHNKNIYLIGYDYWYVDKISCKPIYRNHEWFRNVKDKLELFWNKVQKYKNTNLNTLKIDIEEEINYLKNSVKNSTLFFDLKNYFAINKLESDLEYINKLLENENNKRKILEDFNKNIKITIKKRRID